MSYDVKNGKLQPSGAQIQLTGPQMAALILLERRIAELNTDAQVMNQLGCGALAIEVAKTTETLSKAHADFLTETQRVVKLAAPTDLPRLVTG